MIKIILCFKDLDYELRRQGGNAYVGQRLASGPPVTEEVMVHESPKKQRPEFPQNVNMTIYKVKNVILTIISFFKLKSINFVSLCMSKVLHNIVYLSIIKLDA